MSLTTSLLFAVTPWNKKHDSTELNSYFSLLCGQKNSCKGQVMAEANSQRVGKTETWLSLAQPPKSCGSTSHGKAVEVPHCAQPTELFGSSQPVEGEPWWQQLIIALGWIPAPGVLEKGGSASELGSLELSFMAVPLPVPELRTSRSRRRANLIQISCRHYSHTLVKLTQNRVFLESHFHTSFTRQWKIACGCHVGKALE